jgi:hypothetical protein
MKKLKTNKKVLFSKKIKLLPEKIKLLPENILSKVLRWSRVYVSRQLGKNVI